MRPTASRLVIAVAFAVSSLAIAATTASATDVSSCSLVASEGTDPNPLGTILEAVTVADDGTVWAVGGHVVGPVSSPYVQRWDGTSWTEQKLDLPEGPIGLSSLYDVKSFAPDDVWAVGSWMGEHTLVEHWDGTRWSAVTMPKLGGSENILTGIDGMSSDDVWIVGQRRVDDQEHGVVLHGGLGGFEVVPPPDAAVLHDVAIRADGSPVVAGWRIGADGFAEAVIAGSAGGTWRDEPTPEKEEQNVFLFGLAVQGPTTYAVGFTNASPNGDTPITLRRSGARWTEMPEPDLGASTRLVSVASDAAATVAVGVVSDAGSSRAVAIRWDGDAWRSVPGAGSQPPDALANVALHDGEIWAVGRAVVVGATYGVPSARVYSCG